MSRHTAPDLASTTSYLGALATPCDTVYGDVVEHMFDSLEGEGIDSDAAARGQTTPLPLRLDAAAGGDHLQTESSAAMLLDLLNSHYGEVLAASPSLTADLETVSVAALACARHAAARLSHELAAMTAPERGDFVWQFVPGPDEDSTQRAFWDLLATKLYAYVTHFFPTSWHPLDGLMDEPDWSMPVWRTPLGVVCDLFVYLTPWDNESDIALVAQRALDLAVARFGSEVLGVRVLPLFAPYLARWHYPDGRWTALGEATDTQGLLISLMSQPSITVASGAFEVAR